MPSDLMPPASAEALAAVDDAATRLRRIGDDLGMLVVRAATTAADADWEAPSARAFHDRARGLARVFAGAEVAVDDACASLVRLRSMLLARAAS